MHEVTKRFIRDRQLSPKKFDPKSFRVVKPNKETELIVACPKGHFHAGRCGVGMKVQSILKKRKV